MTDAARVAAMLRDRARAARPITEKAIEQAASEAVTVLRAGSPVQTGTLRSSWHADGGVVANSARYAGYVNGGAVADEALEVAKSAAKTAAIRIGKQIKEG